MYRVYFDNNVINFTYGAVDIPVDIAVAGTVDIAKLLKKVGNSKDISIVSEYPQLIFENFLEFFEVRQAAGGLVRNERDDALMILRGGRWDLPKGHLELGETIAQCAQREVTEETGIGGLVLGEELGETMHIYPLGERWVLKKTRWFAMRATAEQSFVPQIQEGVEQVVWCDGATIEQALTQSYRTIAEVFEMEKNLK